MGAHGTNLALVQVTADDGRQWFSGRLTQLRDGTWSLYAQRKHYPDHREVAPGIVVLWSETAGKLTVVRGQRKTYRLECEAMGYTVVHVQSCLPCQGNPLGKFRP